ncbi:protein kinase [Spirillospora sp. NPDC029432]|uniref:serine/threonine-protein kinase n=1 Tax=Spirillospora sp. NPDC029432 TaxID=3154599 RepID=UPI003454E3C7
MSHDLVLNDRYRLVERLATGGMGEVWRAADQALARAVAVKLLRPELVSDASACARFRAEAQFAAALKHDGIAQVYDVGVQDGRSYLVMELVEGEPLAEIIARAGALPPAAVLDLLAQAGRALAAAHDAGIVHRDIKPANLMVTGAGTVKITDFGIARRLRAAVSQTQTGMVMGTAHYISPEQASGQDLTPSADLYSLGVVAYECLTGHVPFDGDTPVAVALRHVREVPAPLPERVPAPVRDLVYELLGKLPGDRPAGADATADRALDIRDRAGIVGPGLRRWTGSPGRGTGPGLYPDHPAVRPAPAVPARSDPAQSNPAKSVLAAPAAAPDAPPEDVIENPGPVRRDVSASAGTERLPAAPWPTGMGGTSATSGDLSEFDGGDRPDSLASGKVTARRRSALTYTSVAAGTLLLGVIVVGTMWRGIGTTEPLREKQERLPAVQPGEGDPVRRLPDDPATRLYEIERPGQETTRPSPTSDPRSSTPRYPRASPSHKPTRKPPRATPSAPDPTPSPTGSTTTPSTPTPDPSPTDSGELGSEDKV